MTPNLTIATTDGQILTPGQLVWRKLKRERPYLNWVRSWRASRSTHGKSAREKFAALVSRVDFVDQFGVADFHLFSIRREPRIRLNGYRSRRVGLRAAAWAIFKGPIPDGYKVFASCEKKQRCVNSEHMTLKLK